MTGRRSFLRAASLGTLGAGLGFSLPRLALAQRGPASNRVRLALLGCGARGIELGRLARGVPGAEIVGAADLYDGRLARAKELFGETVVAVRDARRLIESAEIDAVVVATPDHWHAAQVQAALAAGKDVYCESPLTHAQPEAAALRQAAQAAGRVVQVGGGAAHAALLAAARELIAGGRLGRVTLVSGVWESAGALRAWQAPFPPDASPETVGFDAFLGSAPRAEFDLARFFRWRRYWEYGCGLAGERFVPQLTLLQALLGLGAPERASASGAVRLWQDGREVPDTFVAMLDYPRGPSVVLSATQCGGRREELRITGSEATLVLRPGELELLPEPQSEPYPLVGESWAREYRDWFYMMHGLGPSGQPRGTPSAEPAGERWQVAAGPAVEAAHLSDFVAAVRSRGRTREDLEQGLAAAAGAHLANAVWRARRAAKREEAA